MKTFKGLPVSGYTEQSSGAVELVNYHKQMEEVILQQLDDLQRGVPMQCDQRWLAVARTHIEQGFMAMNRAVFRPQRVKLEEDA